MWHAHTCILIHSHVYTCTHMYIHTLRAHTYAYMDRTHTGIHRCAPHMHADTYTHILTHIHTYANMVRTHTHIHEQDTHIHRNTPSHSHLPKSKRMNKNLCAWFSLNEYFKKFP